MFYPLGRRDAPQSVIVPGQWLRNDLKSVGPGMGARCNGFGSRTWIRAAGRKRGGVQARIQDSEGGGSYIQKGGVSYRNFRSGSKLLQGPGQINKQERNCRQPWGGGGGVRSPPPPKKTVSAPGVNRDFLESRVGA